MFKGLDSTKPVNLFLFFGNKVIVCTTMCNSMLRPIFIVFTEFQLLVCLLSAFHLSSTHHWPNHLHVLPSKFNHEEDNIQRNKESVQIHERLCPPALSTTQ